MSIILFVMGLIFYEPLHNTPFSVGEYLVFIPAYLQCGWSVLTTAGRNILRGKIFDENFLMTIATLGAFTVMVYSQASCLGVWLVCLWCGVIWMKFQKLKPLKKNF
ncbi:MAG: hypothetical protein WBF90_38025 [Rivularia sp. (in: cyanobacteria)]